MEKIYDHEITIKLRPNDDSKNLFFENSNELIKEFEHFIKNKYPNKISFQNTEKTGIDFFTKRILNNEHFTFVKYGDGELLCMLGAKGENCDFHSYSPRLAKLLQISFAKLLDSKKVFLADWKDNLIDARDSFIKMYNLEPKFADYECFLTVEENIKDNKLLNFYKILKNTNSKKVFVGPEKLKGVKEMFNIEDFITVPSKNAFDDYDSIKSKLISTLDDNNIYMFCCSMMSCVLINDLIELNQNVTCLDIGSGLDPIFSYKSRPKQPSQSLVHKYYRPILPDYLIKDKVQKAASIINNLSSFSNRQG